MEERKKEIFQLLEANQGLLNETRSFKKADKGAFLLKEGQKSSIAIFLIKGITRSYLLKEQEEITIQFNFQYDLLFPLNSYNQNLTSDEYIVALTDVEYLISDLTKFDQLKRQHPQLYTLEAKINELYIFQLATRLRNFQTLNAKERYLQLIKTEPQILQYCSLSHIASYLGIKLGSLSRIRKELS